jgi:hypothetical protein
MSNWGFQAGGPLNSTSMGLLITKHLKLVQILFGPKFRCGCLKFEGLNVELGFFSGGTT